ncbi:MAG: hypothetical protein ABJE10_15135 [bacterium]
MTPFDNGVSMSAGDSIPASSPREGLAEQLRQLEEFIARTEAQGGTLPPEAVDMIARLREIMDALDGLSASFGDDLSQAASNAAKPETE